MQNPEQAYEKALQYSTQMLHTVLQEGAVPIVIIAVRPEDESSILVAPQGVAKCSIVQLLEFSLREARLQLDPCEQN